MILYEYKCSSCGARFEHSVALKDRNEIICPGCGHHDVKKVIATVAKFKKPNSSLSSSSCGCKCGNCKGC